jgi:hypothetical protein
MNSVILRVRPVLGQALLCILFHATGTYAAEDRNAAATGTWGGEHVLLQVSKNGTDLEFDCARGQITQPIALDKHGNFDVPGTFTPEHGGPVARDESVPFVQARYSGHVDGERMSLTVTREQEEFGPFALTHDQHPNLRKCR